jgi:hypothetical protein
VKLPSARGCKTKPGPFARLRFVPAVAGLLVLIGCACYQTPLAASRPSLGANVDLASLRAAERAALLERLGEAGVTSVRMELDWNRVEPRSEEFTWEAFDEAVDAARERGFEIVFVLGPCAVWAVNPAWQVPPEEAPRSVPQSIEVWRRYVRSAVTHFRGRVAQWQVREQPSAQNFRGARREYAALLRAAAEEARAADPAARIIVPEAGYLDIAAMDRFIARGGCDYVDVLGVYLPQDPCDLPLPWAVLAHEVVGRCEPEKRRPFWVLDGATGESAPMQWQLYYLMAWAFGAERCYLPPDAIDTAWTSRLADLDYRGFTSPAAGALALVFERRGGAPVAVAWSASEVQIPASEPAQRPVRIGPAPTVIDGIEFGSPISDGAPSRADVLAARGGPELKDASRVYADYSASDTPEVGLYNRRLRALRGGQALEESRGGRTCLRTQLNYRRGEEEKDNPWLYFDVDDAWMYFDRGESKLAITVECEAALVGPKRLGFNILYDSTRGYRFTPWQWVDVGQGWRRYRFEISDASFTNRDGYDFRINTKGSKQDLYVCSVTVEKLPIGPAETATEQAGNDSRAAPAGGELDAAQ